ncbi:nuclear transport factor 2 family protein [Chitinimonas sp. BJYL2]|uniref:nuclear transport factor 2 family protein n=1 Tax=Chitinimonas sp. BJYL2 TaxID=2976696 RepID=UPI0022B4C0C3|nr:nuclear transport factor 2 family protein [Chitinimonas sp. BJYL2]
MSNLRTFSIAIALAASGLSGCAIVIAADGHSVNQARSPSVNEAVDNLLGAYSANDADKVVGMLDRGGFVLFGNDVAAKVSSEAGVRQLMSQDFALWKKAAVGPVQDLDIRQKGELATAYFHVPVTAEGKPTAMVRFATTWRRVDGKWRLTQSANTVPTALR